MWRRRTRPDPDDLVPRDDIAQAREIRSETTAELRAVRQQAQFVQRISEGLIDRQGKNHYIELLYRRLPKGAS